MNESNAEVEKQVPVEWCDWNRNFVLFTFLEAHSVFTRVYKLILAFSWVTTVLGKELNEVSINDILGISMPIQSKHPTSCFGRFPIVMDL